jgi:hypothetical protein
MLDRKADTGHGRLGVDSGGTNQSGISGSGVRVGGRRDATGSSRKWPSDELGDPVSCRRRSRVSIRLCANTGAALHVIKPLPWRWSLTRCGVRSASQDKRRRETKSTLQGKRAFEHGYAAAAYISLRRGSGARQGASQQQTRTPHVHALMNAPRPFGKAAIKRGE